MIKVNAISVVTVVTSLVDTASSLSVAVVDHTRIRSHHSWRTHSQRRMVTGSCGRNLDHMNYSSSGDADTYASYTLLGCVEVRERR